MSWRKGSTVSNDTSAGSGGSRGGVVTKPAYPFALALRIRVVQIVCGIAEVVMGSVAAIEERRQLNLSMGVPAGAMVVLAAAWSVHRSVHRDAGGRRGGACWSRVLWCLACSLQLALFFLAVRTAINRQHRGEEHTSNTSLALAGIQGFLTSCALCACLAAARMRYLYGRAPPFPPPRNANCPRSTSHTAVSMVPMTCNYSYPPTSGDANNKDTLSSDNEMMEISLVDNRTNSYEADLSAINKSPKAQEPSVKLPTNPTPEQAVLSKMSGDYDARIKDKEHAPLKSKESTGLSDKNIKEQNIDKVVNSVDFTKSTDFTEKSNNNNAHEKRKQILI